jgi:8-amino-7-oxononanoate synthase
MTVRQHMETLDAAAEAQLLMLQSKDLSRVPKPTARAADAAALRGGRELISFSCNDYLGLTHHPRVLAAARSALEKHGAGAGASRLVTGSHPLYEELENLLAEMKGTDAACVFGSGYLANLGTIPALVDANDLILADRLVHACMLDGARLSGATLIRFAHNSVAHCAELLRQHRKDHPRCLILTETVFSMDGDRAPVAALKALCAGHDAWLMTDDAHGLGVDSSESDAPSADIQMGTLSKAAGSYGGYVCASESVIALLKSTARSLLFSTALPPATLAASVEALRFMREEPDRLRVPVARAQLFAQLMGLPEAQSAIVPLVLGDVETTVAASELLEANGFLVTAIRPPTVPSGTARLRFTFSACHTEEQVRRVADFMKQQGIICKP